MKVSEAFPSDYLKASDLNGKQVKVTIGKVELVEMGQGQDKETKLLIHFNGKQKGLVCNKTNASTIEALYGGETNDWLGKEIFLAPREVEFQGKMVWAIRVSLQKPGAPVPAPSDNDGGIDESVGF
jgi:hypothetical protein